MEINSVWWCWWMSRYLIYKGKIGNEYFFEDYGDAHIMLNRDDLHGLERV